MPQAKKVAEVEPEGAETRIRFNGKDYTVPEIDDFTYDEIEVIEDAFNLPIGQIDTRRAKFQRWMYFVALSRAGAQVDGRPIQFDDIGRIQFGDIEEVDGSAEGPTSEAAPAAA